MVLALDRASSTVAKRRGATKPRRLAQLVRASALQAEGRQFESVTSYHLKALSQVGKAQDSDSCIDGSSPSGPTTHVVKEVMLI